MVTLNTVKDMRASVIHVAQIDVAVISSKKHKITTMLCIFLQC